MNPIFSPLNFESSLSVKSDISLPSISIEPSVTLSSKPIIFSKVDLPLPDCPTIATKSPSLTFKETPSSAFTGGGPS